jgi:hypothetical protein
MSNRGADRNFGIIAAIIVYSRKSCIVHHTFVVWWRLYKKRSGEHGKRRKSVHVEHNLHERESGVLPEASVVLTGEEMSEVRVTELLVRVMDEEVDVLLPCWIWSRVALVYWYPNAVMEPPLVSRSFVAVMGLSTSAPNHEYLSTLFAQERMSFVNNVLRRLLTSRHYP